MADPATRPYRTEVPNLIDDMDLSVYAFRLYIHIKRVAGPNGTCYEGTRTLAEKCRMSVGMVSGARQELIEKGLIAQVGERTTRGGTIAEYSPVDIWQENYESYASVHQVNTNAESVQEANTNGQSVHESVHESVHQVNERKNNKKEHKNIGDARKTRTRPPSEKQEPTPALIREALAETCEVDMDIGTKEQKLQVNTSARDLYEKGMQAGKTPDEIADAIRYVGGYFRKHHWKGKDGSVPRPADIREVWRQAITYRNRHAIPATANGHEPKRTILSAEERRRIIAEEAARNGLEPDRRTL
jgi:predicted transcriptional regulator